jgi:hypothetical protein
MLNVLTGVVPTISSKRISSRKFSEMIVSGKTYFIPNKYWSEEATPAEHVLAETIRRCYKYKPDERPTIFEVVEILENAVQDMEKAKGVTRMQILQTL